MLAGLAAGFHDEAARFLAAMSPQEGVREALALPGLTPPAEMALSIRCVARGRCRHRAPTQLPGIGMGVAGAGMLQHTNCMLIQTNCLSMRFALDFAAELARLLAGLSSRRAALIAAPLPALCCRSDNWDRAARCFQALALGVSDKGLLQARLGQQSVESPE